MFAQVHRPKETENKGSCIKLADYLDKEKDSNFFSLDSDIVSIDDVVNRIDKNVMQLGKEDDKFYMLSFNPSRAELEHIAGRRIFNKSELTDYEKVFNSRISWCTGSIYAVYRM